MEWIHEPREAAWGRRLTTRLQKTLNGNQGTAEACSEARIKEPEGSTYGKEDDQQPI